MSHDSTYGPQLPAVVRPCPLLFELNHLSSADPYAQPLLQQKADKHFCETSGNIQEPRPIRHQSIDSVLETLRLEMGRHKETQQLLHTSRKTNDELEQLLFQERSFNHSLRVCLQEAEMKKIIVEGKLQARERQNVYYGSSQSTPLSDYKSATFSPAVTLLSMRDTTLGTPEGKRKADLAMRVPATPKRPRTINFATKPADQEFNKEEFEEDSEKEDLEEEDLEDGELEGDTNDSGRSSVISLLV